MPARNIDRFSVSLIFCVLFSTVYPCFSGAAVTQRRQPQASSSSKPVKSKKVVQKIAEVLSPMTFDQLQKIILARFRSKPARALQKAYVAFEAGKYSLAIKQAAKWTSNEKFSDYASWISASAYQALAEEALNKKDYNSTLSFAQKAAASQNQIFQKNPYSPFLKDVPKAWAESELFIGNTYWRKKSWRLSRLYFEKAFERLALINKLSSVNPKFVQSYSEGCSKNSDSFCMSWLQKLASSFTKKSEQSKLIVQYFPNLTTQPKPASYGKANLTYKAPDLDLMTFDNSMKYYSEKKYSDAIKSFRAFLDSFPRSAYRFRAQYWLARALHQDRKKEEAESVYGVLFQDTPLSYYGLLAAQQLGKSIQSQINQSAPLTLDTDPNLQPHDAFHLERAKYFIAERAPDLAAFELKEIKNRDYYSSPFLAYLAYLNHQVNNNNLSFLLIGELLQRKYEGILSNNGLPMIFPVHFMDIIKKYSVENNLDPILVLSLIKQESGFEEDVNSYIGAIGLMQLMPATALDTVPDTKLEELIKAEKNIRAGTKYLAKLLNYYQGNLVYAIASYNAGPTAVNRWIKEAPLKQEMEEFIELIPYRETREYVAAIIRNYYWYSLQLDPSHWKGFGYFWKNNKGELNSTKLQNGNA